MKRAVRFIIVIVYIAIAAYGCYGSWVYGTRFFLYFTNLGNLYCLGMMINELARLIRRKPISVPLMQWEFGGFISILVIGAVYNILLGAPTSTAYWENRPSICLHLLTPILYAVYFLGTRPIRKVTVGGIQCGILLPYLYIAFIYTRHFITGDPWFPYFFLDVNHIGWLGATTWIIALTAVFVLVGLIFIYIGRKKSKRS